MENNAPITKIEACEFLKYIKHSEYNVVDQLSKMLAKISLLLLLQNFELHRDALMKVLNQAYVANNVSIDKVDQLVGNIMMVILSHSVMMRYHQKGVKIQKLYS